MYGGLGGTTFVDTKNGNTQIFGTNGDDLFYISKFTGSDTIIGGGGSDILAVSGYTSADATISSGASSTIVDLKNELGGQALISVSGIDVLHFSDGSTLRIG
ncbi:hypothetical protein DK412_06655 [Methylobacterium sp. 17Sr1-1]|nr:hypothetical protein DK412_06655 [Methylobacterium sp. 17Sr1-1]